MNGLSKFFKESPEWERFKSQNPPHVYFAVMDLMHDAWMIGFEDCSALSRGSRAKLEAANER